MTTLPLLLGYAALLFVALLALLSSHWPAWLKGALVAGVTMLYFYANGVVHDVWGWPTADPLPARFVLRAVIIEQPTTKLAGGLYVWVSAIEDGKPSAQPRAYRLDYDKLEHVALEEATKKMHDGISQMGELEATEEDIGGLAWLHLRRSAQKFKLKDLVGPQLPEK